MQEMRDLIRTSLARSLRPLSDEDRIAAALPVVCGSALAAHCEIAALDEQNMLRIRVDGAQWMSPLQSMQELLRHDLQRVAGVCIAGVHFVQAGFASDRSQQMLVAERAQDMPGRQRSVRQSTFVPKGRLA